MSSKLLTNKSRFIGFLSDFEKRIWRTAELAQVTHDADTLLRIASLELGPISTYCEAIGLNRRGDTNGAEELARQLIESSPSGFKARALVILAHNRMLSDPDHAVTLYERAKRLADDPGTALTIIKMNAVVFSAAFGDYQRALTALEDGVPLLRQMQTNPPLRIDYLNSLAVENTNLGRFDQARQLCNITTTSPWSRLFPKWMDTARTLSEVDPKGRAMSITVPRQKATLLRFTPAPQESPVEQIVDMRLDAGIVVSELGNARLLSCIAQFGSLHGPNLELMMRVQTLDPALAQAFLHQIDKHDSVEECVQCENHP